ncbi:hypothetical protein M2192_000105 [Bradyrhizobium elkanii USDA 61]|nr:hypothetical protein [Bradyrhizobium elkanii USDA 61]
MQLQKPGIQHATVSGNRRKIPRLSRPSAPSPFECLTLRSCTSCIREFSWKWQLPGSQTRPLWGKGRDGSTPRRRPLSCSRRMSIDGACGAVSGERVAGPAGSPSTLRSGTAIPPRSGYRSSRHGPRRT